MLAIGVPPATSQQTPNPYGSLASCSSVPSCRKGRGCMPKPVDTRRPPGPEHRPRMVLLSFKNTFRSPRLGLRRRSPWLSASARSHSLVSASTAPYPSPDTPACALTPQSWERRPEGGAQRAWLGPLGNCVISGRPLLPLPTPLQQEASLPDC